MITTKNFEVFKRVRPAESAGHTMLDLEKKTRIAPFSARIDVFAGSVRPRKDGAANGGWNRLP